MDTEVIDLASVEAPEESRHPRTPMLIASAALGAVLAAILVLVWSYSSGPQSTKLQPSGDTSASEAASPPAEPLADPAESGMPGLPDGLPEGLIPGGATGDAGALDMASMFKSASTGSGGGAAAPAYSLPAPPAFPPPPDMATVMDSLAPYVGTALMPSIVSGDAIAGIFTAAGGWATAAGVATANNATVLLSNLILANAINGNGGQYPFLGGIPNTNPLDVLMRAFQGVGSLGNLPAIGLPSLPAPDQALSGLSSALAVSVPALDALGKLSFPQFPAPAIGMPQLPPPPPIGLPQLPPPPPIGLPQLPPPPPIGLPPPPPLGLLTLGLPSF